MSELLRSAALELSDIQRVTLRGYRFGKVRLLFLSVDNGFLFRHSLRTLMDKTPPLSADAIPEAQAICWNIAFTAAGLSQLKKSLQFEQWDLAFSEGMPQRAAILKDFGQNEPQNWDFGNKDLHCVLLINAEESNILDQNCQLIEQQLKGFSTLWSQDAYKPEDDCEHFGFKDGISQPSIEGLPSSQKPGGGLWDSSIGSWRPLKAGLFVLGYETEELAVQSPSSPFQKNGSYLVIRKLEQNVEAFRLFLTEQSKGLNIGEEELGAKIVGRWRDGTPVVSSPSGENDHISSSESRVNNFNFDDDVAGAKCPIGAHIRRANPRQDPAVGVGRNTMSIRRIIRRGLVYGPKLPEGSPDDGQERGLMFIAVCANLQQQFEFIQTAWINDSEFDREIDSVDPICGVATDGSGSERFRIPGKGTLSKLPSFVVLRGGGYFFIPGLIALKSICE